MALKLKIDSQVFISSDCKTLSIKDSTGNYDVTDNPGGYGAPNLERADLALFAQVLTFKTDPFGDLDKNQLIFSIDPAVDASWNLEQDKDGYYKFRLVGIALWNSTAAYTTNDLVYVQNTTSIYRAAQSSTNEDPETPNTQFWEVLDTEDTVTNTSLIDNTANTVTSNYFKYVLNCRAAKCYTDNSIKYANSVINHSCDCKEDGFADWQKLHALYNGVLSLIVQERYLDAQEVLEQISSICEELNCGCQC